MSERGMMEKKILNPWGRHIVPIFPVGLVKI